MPFRAAFLRDLDWKPVVGAVEAARRVALTTHVRSDTDGIGSELAFHRWLTRRGIEARILNPEAIPERLRPLDPDRAVEAFRPADAAWVAQATVMVFDVSERTRLGPFDAIVQAHRGTSICIDHHLNEHRRFATINLIEPRAAATGVLTCALLEELGAEIDAPMAAALYATIVADTGSFRHTNTSADVLRLAADLVDLGADPSRVTRAVLYTYSPEKLRLLASTLAAPGSACNGQLVWFGLSRARMREVGAREDDTEGLVEYLRVQRGVRAAIYLIEQPGGEVKVSFRCEEGLDVNRLARRWEGGGHRHASGAVLPGPLDRAVAEVVEAAKATLFG